ncbi:MULTISPECIES: hypothetical protein [Pseudomonas]|jgi:hypothetical protein|nr:MULTISPECIES: hypothetical protein [Pseudomonas]MBV7526007.1 hypothetical protein [Pseudomonas sp. PDM29]
MRKPQKKNERLGQFNGFERERHCCVSLAGDDVIFDADDYQVTKQIE